VLRALIWIVTIVAIAVGLTLLARHGAGYVLVVSPPYRIELSLNLLLLLLAAAFLVFYFIVRMVAATVHLPGQVREYRAARRRRKARATLASALHEYFAGRYARAEKAAQRAFDMGEQPDLSAVLAARAAHGLRAYERRDDYLARAAAAAGGDQPMQVVTEAELLLEQRRFEEALEALRRLPRPHTAALRLELKAQQQLRNWDQTLALVNELQRRKVFDAEQATEIRRVALVENLRRKALDVAALEEAWHKMPAKERTDSRIAAAAARCFIALGGCAQAHRIIEEALESSWDSEIVALYAECDGGDALRRIERAESWLRSYPRDAVLLLTLGKLCGAQELWGKAQSYLEASIAVDPTYSAHLALAGLHERLGNAEVARFHQRASLDLALSHLKAVTGGRRRTPL
jgi:HemY protein